MKRDKWRTPASPRRSGTLTMRGCGKAIERLLGGIAPLPHLAQPGQATRKVANDANLSPIPKLQYNLGQMGRWRKFDQKSCISRSSRPSRPYDVS